MLPGPVPRPCTSLKSGNPIVANDYPVAQALKLPASERRNARIWRQEVTFTG
jgi:hypothetical protein